jgi:zinc/manganese transport system substrate-binding protein
MKNHLHILFKILPKIFLPSVLLISYLPTVQADELNIFACEPEWGALASELGGDDVNVFTATTAQQDPHHIQARPSLIAKMRRADLVICTGSGLEVGWLPLLLRQSGNSQVQPGQPGYFETTKYVTTLDKPQVLDRSEGDVHPGGNPHIQTDPHNISKVADALLPVLQQLDNDHKDAYGQRARDFQNRWQSAPLRGVHIVVHHKSWVYLEQWLGLINVTTLEPKPGVPASAGYLSDVLKQLQSQPAKMIIHAAYQNDRADQWLSNKTGIPAIALPFTVGGNPQAQDLFSLYDDTIERLLAGLKHG